ncbi:MAG TPA: hypothetical protein VHA52_02955, partial [Candidatus Babeliaceae bacterium]|nr:hypothetical protein [Candidatus Babeliaceae bacterium]
MTKITALLIMVLFLFSNCTKVKKNTANDYPEVKTLSARLLPNGSVQVTGQIVHAGAGEILYAGVCFDTTKMPDMLANQTLTDTIIGDSFSCVYPLSYFDIFKTYNFRAWAVNQNGYAMGSPIALSNISLSQSDIPCD